MNYHHEQLPSAIRRYQDESIRIVGVLDRHLRTTGQEYLVAEPKVSPANMETTHGRYTYVDAAFIPWAMGLDWVLRDRENIFAGGKYEHYQAWLSRCLERPAVKAGLEEKDRVIAETSGSLVDKQLKDSVNESKL